MTKLPGLLADIAEIAGTDVAMKIAQDQGGRRVDIPARAKGDHWLTNLLGFEVADKICRGLATIDADGRPCGIRHGIIPLGANSVLKAAKRIAAEALESGKTAREAARLSGLHERTIWRMKAEDDRQGRLF